jgi:hypothetical protein
LNGWNDWLFLSSSPVITDDQCKREVRGERTERTEINQERTETREKTETRERTETNHESINGRSTETLILQNAITAEEKCTNMNMFRRKNKKCLLH